VSHYPYPRPGTTGHLHGVDASTLPNVLEGNAETSGVYQKAALRATGRPEKFALSLC
jgi:hypothetical protein